MLDLVGIGRAWSDLVGFDLGSFWEGTFTNRSVKELADYPEKVINLLTPQVRQLRETLISQVAAAVVGKQIEGSLTTTDDEEYFDTEKGAEP